MEPFGSLEVCYTFNESSTVADKIIIIIIIMVVVGDEAYLLTT